MLCSSQIIQTSFKSVQKNPNDLFDLIHSDICDNKTIETRSGKRYFITYIDDYSIYTYD